MEFIIDSREHKLLSMLKDIGTTETLDVGDFLFKINSEPYLVIERKTYADLASSIQGGRYREQKARMKGYKCKKKAYLIEGPYPHGKTFGRIPVSTLDSSILGTSIRDGYIVIHSQSLKHSADLLKKLHSKILEYSSVVDDVIDDQYKASLMNVVKKENLTPEVCYIAQLAQIPGISTQYAAAVATKYTSMRQLLQECEDVKNLSEIPITLKNGSTRRLGAAAANKIMTYMKPPTKLILKTVKITRKK
jgi:ERCC4-type nuclease